MDLASFATNEQTVLAVKYALLIISEAATTLGDIGADLCPDIPWREIRGLGNRLRHDYATSVWSGSGCCWSEIYHRWKPLAGTRDAFWRAAARPADRLYRGARSPREPRLRGCVLQGARRMTT